MKISAIILILMLATSCDNKKMVEDEPTEISDVPNEEIDPRTFLGKDFGMDDQHSYVGFKIKYFGFSPVRGRFDNFNGTLFYDESNIASISASIFIDVNSINTGDDTRDDDLLREGTWFNTAQFPMMSFRSSEIIQKESGAFDLVGELTIKGITKIDTIEFSKPGPVNVDYGGSDQVDFFGRFTINRQDFDVVGEGFWSTLMENGLTQLSDEVEVEVDIHTGRANYQKRYNDMDSLNIRKVVLDEIKSNGIQSGLKLVEEENKKDKISSGALSTIGYTLNVWQMHEEAKAIFETRLANYPDKYSSWNQIGITNLLMGNNEVAKRNFETMLKLDSIDSRAHEYLRLIDKLD